MADVPLAGLPTGQVKIGVLGNCQVSGLASCLQALLPDTTIIAAKATGTHIFEDVAGSDAYFVQTDCGDWVWSYFSQHGIGTPRLIRWPTFFFPGYHPDLVFARASNGDVLSPCQSYNSSIVLYGFLQGLSPRETQRLFCEAVYERLGFFNYWSVAESTVIDEFNRCDLDGHDLVQQWRAGGCFCYSVNHPKIGVLDSFAETLVRRAGLEPVSAARRRAPMDPLADLGNWPVYPEIARHLGIDGSYEFTYKAWGPLEGRHNGVMDLEQFVTLSAALYSDIPKDQIFCDRLVGQKDLYAGLERLAQRGSGRPKNPYSGLPDYAFWRKSIEAVPPDAVDPVVQPRFSLTPIDRIATAGSCFAQHIARTLAESSHNYYIAEPPPPDKSAQWVSSRGYGLFSARYGNIYTARQLLQLVERACGEFLPADRAWRRHDGRYVDAFRPQIEPDGFGSVQEVEDDRRCHLSAVRRLFEEIDIFIFTVGLTEAWMSKVDGAVFPVAPGVAAGKMDPERYGFVNFTVSEIRRDLVGAITKMKVINPRLRVILTVSPVPLIATYEQRHVLVSTTYSKSALRAAVDEVYRLLDYVDYFPSYEIITGNFNEGRYFESDRRNIKPEGVAHVMRLFRAHYFDDRSSGQSSATAIGALSAPVEAALRAEIAANARLVCDEELLDQDLAVERDVVGA